MAVRARLNFDTVIGNEQDRIVYQLDILDETYTGAPLGLIGHGDNPVMVDQDKNLESVYKAILGSVMDINLMVPNDTYVLPDFNAGNPFQYEVVLRILTTSASSVSALNFNGTQLHIQGIFNRGSAATPGTYYRFSRNTTTNGADLSAAQIQALIPVGTTLEINGIQATVTHFDSTFGGSIGVGFDEATPITGWNIGDDVSVLIPGTSEFTNVWCGYINPIQSKEKVGTYPFPITFTATDRLGALNNQPLIFPNVAHDSSLIGYIGRALRQTGLNIPLYVDSGIRNTSGDALLDVSASEFSFFDDNAERLFSEGRSLGDRATLREALEGVLETFNCRLKQSEAKWWIENCSNSGNATDTNVVYAQFVPDARMNGRDTNNRFPGDTGYVPTVNIEEYVRGEYTGGIMTTSGVISTTNFVEHTSSTNTDVTIPSLRYNLDGTSNADITILGEDLVLTLRDPFGSVEARPENLEQDPFHPNYDFHQLPDTPVGARSNGWTVHLRDDSTIPSASPNLAFATETGDYLTGGRSITTNRNVFEIEDGGAHWFESIDSFAVDPGSPTQIKFDWKYNDLESDLRDPRIPFRIRLDLPSAITVREIDTRTIASTLAGPVSVTTDVLYWNFRFARWEHSFLQDDLQNAGILGVMRSDSTLNVDAARGIEENVWGEVSVEVAPFETYTGFLDELAIPTGSAINVEFYFPQGFRGNNGKRQSGSDTGRANFYIDNVSITDMFVDSDENPVYEYRQPNHTLTDAYNPRFISSGPNSFRQRLTSGGTPIASNSLWVKGESATNGRSLEEIVTGQKLRDNKTRLQYFEGTVVNRTTTPIQFHNKININYTGYGNNGVLTLNGGTWNVKQNTLDFGGYIAQASELDSDDIFTEYDVDLISARFDGTRIGSRYLLQPIVRGVDPTTGAVVANSIGAVPILELSTTGEIIISPLAGFVTTGAPTLRSDTITTPRPNFVTLDTDTSGNLVFRTLSAGFNQPTTSGATTTRGVAGSLGISVMTTDLPNYPEYEEIHIDVPVTPFVAEVAPDDQEVSVVINNAIVGSSNLGNNTIRVAAGANGQRRTIRYTFGGALSGGVRTHDVFASDVNVNFAASSSNFIQSTYRETETNGATEISIEYEITTGESSATLAFTGSATPVQSDTTQLFDFYAGFSESISGVSITSDSPVRHRDVAGKREQGQFFLESDEGRFLNASGFAQSGTTAGISDIEFIQISTTVVEGRYVATIGNATIGSSTTPRTITIVETSAGAGVGNEPFSTTFVANNLGIDGGSISFDDTEAVSTFRRGYTQGTTTFQSFNMYVTPPAGMMYSNSNNIEVDINEASVVNTDTGTRITLPESQFTVTPASTPINSDGQLVYVIDGTFPTTGGNYVLDVNVRGAAVLQLASTGKFTLDDITVPLAGGSLRAAFTANGRINIIEGTSPTQPGSNFLTAQTIAYNSGGTGVVTQTVDIPQIAAERVAYWLMYPENQSAGTPLDAVRITQTDGVTTIETTTRLQTFPIRLSGSGFSEPNVYTYLDFNGERRVVTLGGSATSDVCVVGTNFTEARANIEDLSVVGGAGPTTGSGNCSNPTSSGTTYASESGNSETTNGFTIQALGSAPPVGTPNTTITFRT